MPVPKSTRKSSALRQPWRTRLLALALAAIALFISYRVMLHVPAIQVWRLNQRTESVRAAFDAANQKMSPDVSTAELCRAASHALLAVDRNPASRFEQRNLLRHVAARVTNSQLPRWQAAALVLLEMEQTGVPAEQWAARVQPYLEKLQPRAAPHFLAELLTRDAAIYESQGLSPGLAAQAAAERVGHWHHALLQLLAPRLEKMRDASTADGPSPALEFSRAWRNLLHEWLTRPGPLDLRLLVADLLAASLMDSYPPVDSARVNAGTALKMWRTTICQRRRAAMPPPTLIDPFRGPSEPATSATADNAGQRFFTWTAACAVLGVMMLALLLTLFVRCSPTGKLASAHWAGAFAMLTMANLIAPTACQNELLLAWGTPGMLPHYIGWSALAGLILLAIEICWFRGSIFQRLAAAAIPMTVSTAIWVSLDGVFTYRSLSQHDHQVKERAIAEMKLAPTDAEPALRAAFDELERG